MCSCGPLGAPCPAFLSWERAAAVHMDQLLCGVSVPGARGAKPVAPFGVSGPVGAVLHVCRPAAVRFLSSFEDRADVDFECLADVANAARAAVFRGGVACSVSHSTVFDRVVVWVDARRVSQGKVGPPPLLCSRFPSLPCEGRGDTVARCVCRAPVWRPW